MKIFVAEILNDVAESHEVPIEEILGRRKPSHIVSARHEFFFRALTEGGKSSSWIAGRYGFNRVSVMHGAARHAEEFGLNNPTGLNLKSRRERANERYRRAA